MDRFMADALKRAQRSTTAYTHETKPEAPKDPFPLSPSTRNLTTSRVMRTKSKEELGGPRVSPYPATSRGRVPQPVPGSTLAARLAEKQAAVDLSGLDTDEDDVIGEAKKDVTENKGEN